MYNYKDIIPEIEKFDCVQVKEDDYFVYLEYTPKGGNYGDLVLLSKHAPLLTVKSQYLPDKNINAIVVHNFRFFSISDIVFLFVRIGEFDSVDGVLDYEKKV